MTFSLLIGSQAVDITSCGNFAVIGTSGGRIDVYNMQSGIHRGCYVDKEKGALGGCACRLFLGCLYFLTSVVQLDNTAKWTDKKARVIKKLLVFSNKIHTEIQSAAFWLLTPFPSFFFLQLTAAPSAASLPTP